MKVLKTACRWLFVLCLPLLLFTASVTWAANSLWLYEYGFNKYDVDRTTSLAPAELEKAARGLIGYFNSGDEDISLTVTKDGQPFTLFNEREVGHLRDVKGLFRLVYKILLGTAAYALVFTGLSFFLWRDRRNLARGLLWGGGLSLALMAALGLGALFNFDWLFWQFHLISFANDLWLLDPAHDYLIMLFPQGFWYDAAIFCVLAAVTGAVILGGVGWWYVKRNEKAKQPN
jgi:integral membrane protein (TIGR01906 family)